MDNDILSAAEPQTTGRFVVTYRQDTPDALLDSLNMATHLAPTDIARSSDFGLEGMDMDAVQASGSVLFENIGVAVLAMDPASADTLTLTADEASPILAVEPEYYVYALSDLENEYLRGFRDAADAITDGIGSSEVSSDQAARTIADTEDYTWGLLATGVDQTEYSGDGIKVAVLDTGMDFNHPDFTARTMHQKSFISGQQSQDGNGHGTHCIGTACGPLNPSEGRRYGIAHKAEIFVGKVLSDQGRGNDTGILAGIDWAVGNGCEVISMSLGARVPRTSIAYETTGKRALDAGTLIVAAAGNDARRTSRRYGYVNRPANSKSMMGVGALDRYLAIADFSNRDTIVEAGTGIDIAGPGVQVYSSWPMETKYRSISGTSMATPHVAGIAALWAEATSARGAALWQQILTNAQSLPLPYVDVGRGLVQAP